jgi:hypothetical protein
VEHERYNNLYMFLLLRSTIDADWLDRWLAQVHAEYVRHDRRSVKFLKFTIERVYLSTWVT